MNREDNEFRLLAGMPVLFEGAKIYSPLLRDIAEVGYSKYNEYLSTMLFDQSVVELTVEEKLTDLEILFLFSYQDKEFQERLFKSFEFFLREAPIHQHANDSVFFLFEESGFKLSNENFDRFQKCIEMVSCTKRAPKEEKYRPANDAARKLIERFNQYTIPKKKDEMTLYSVVNGLAWRENGISIKDAFDLTVYQIYQAFMTIEHIDNYLFTLHGIYAGTVDIKKVKMSKIHWANKVNL